MLSAYLTTRASILAVELTDKTRLIALMLSARYRAPGQLIGGMTLGYVPAIVVAVLGAGLITRAVPESLMRWALAAMYSSSALRRVPSRS